MGLMHRSIYINKNNGINIVCLPGAFVFSQILPLLIRPVAGTKLHVHAAVVHKRFLVHKQPPNFFFFFFPSEGEQKLQRLNSQRRKKNGSQSLKGERCQLYIKVHLCVLCGFATYARERRRRKNVPLRRLRLCGELCKFR